MVHIPVNVSVAGFRSMQFQPGDWVQEYKYDRRVRIVELERFEQDDPRLTYLIGAATHMKDDDPESAILVVAYAHAHLIGNGKQIRPPRCLREERIYYPPSDISKLVIRDEKGILFTMPASEEKEIQRNKRRYEQLQIFLNGE